MEHPRSLMGSRDSPRTMATPTITMTRLAVLATDWVTAEVCDDGSAGRIVSFGTNDASPKIKVRDAVEGLF